METPSDKRRLTVRADTALIARAEEEARRRGTTLTRLLAEHVRTVAEGRAAAEAPEWLDDPRQVLWTYLDSKHR